MQGSSGAARRPYTSTASSGTTTRTCLLGEQIQTAKILRVRKVSRGQGRSVASYFGILPLLVCGHVLNYILEVVWVVVGFDVLDADFFDLTSIDSIMPKLFR